MGTKPVNLSAQDRIEMGALGRMPALQGLSELFLAQALLADLMIKRVGRGDRPHDELDGAAIMVREAYNRHTGDRASASKEGNFVHLLNSVVSVARNEPRIDSHRLAERVLAEGQFIQESPGVTLIIPPRFVE